MAKLIKFESAKPVERGQGIESIQLTGDPLDGQCFTLGITSFPPGASIRLHSHNTVEQVTVIEGSGKAEIDGELLPARPYDTTQIAPGEMHRFINDGNETMRILWVYGSTTVTRTFADTGETVGQFDQ